MNIHNNLKIAIIVTKTQHHNITTSLILISLLPVTTFSLKKKLLIYVTAAVAPVATLI
jgi:hypothetical protein